MGVCIVLLCAYLGRGGVTCGVSTLVRTPGNTRVLLCLVDAVGIVCGCGSGVGCGCEFLGASSLCVASGMSVGTCRRICLGSVELVGPVQGQFAVGLLHKR
eukprot:443603-Ditylum_brightwellii.AAC.1